MNGILLPYILISKGRQFDIEKLAIFVLKRKEKKGEGGRDGEKEVGKEEMRMHGRGEEGNEGRKPT